MLRKLSHEYSVMNFWNAEMEEDRHPSYSINKLCAGRSVGRGWWWWGRNDSNVNLPINKKTLRATMKKMRGHFGGSYFGKKMASLHCRICITVWLFALHLWSGNPCLRWRRWVKTQTEASDFPVCCLFHDRWCQQMPQISLREKSKKKKKILGEDEL